MTPENRLNNPTPDVDTSYIDLVEGRTADETAPSNPDNANTLEETGEATAVEIDPVQIASAEAELKQNIEQLTTTVDGVLETSTQDIREGALLKSRVRQQKIENAFEKTKSKINNLVGLGGLGIATILMGGWMGAGAEAHHLEGVMDPSSVNWMDTAGNLGNAGAITIAVTAAVFALSHALNKFNRWRGEKEDTEKFNSDMEPTVA